MNRREWIKCAVLPGTLGAVRARAAQPAAAPASPPRIGVNCFDLLYGPLVEPKRVRAPSVRLKEMAELGIPFVRFAASPFWPSEWRSLSRNKTRFFDLMDEIFETARAVDVELVPSLIWGQPFLADAVGERVNAWGRAGSATLGFAREHVTSVVRRYAGAKTVLFWEFGNEFNVALDLNDQHHWWPKANPAMGTPAVRSPADMLTTVQYQVAVENFCAWVAESAPGMARGSGADRPRPNAFHLARGSRDIDTPSEFRSAVQAANPRCAEVASMHLYPDSRTAYFGRTSTTRGLLSEAKAAAAAANQRFFLGEFGVPAQGTEAAQRALLAEFLDAIEMSQVDLAALWVYDFHYQPQFTVTPTNERAWQLRAITDWNERIRRRATR